MSDGRDQEMGESLRRAGVTAREVKDKVANALSFHRSDTMHIAKTTLAAVLAWAVARWLTVADAAIWMGPATAVVVVRTTVYRSLADGLRRVGAVTAGVIISGLVGRLLGLNAISLVLIVPLALLATRWRRVGDRGPDIVTTAVLMLSYGASVGHSQYLQHYLIQTVIGALTGVAVNLVIPPPLRTRHAYDLVRDITQDTADLLGRIADDLCEGYGESEAREWQRDVDALDTELGVAVEALRDGAESRRFNPRRWHSPEPAPQECRPMLQAMRLAMPSVNSIVRALGHMARQSEEAPDAPPALSESFARAYAELLRVIAEAIAAQGRDPARPEEDARRQATASLEKVSAIHERMTGLVRDGELSRPGAWAVSGSLLVDAERVVSTLTWCADNLAEAR
jgi:uncharacterized membrane protein YgaE (UPF0421/DUF939 family)